jgi:hypothetical protein
MLYVICGERVTSTYATICRICMHIRLCRLGLFHAPILEPPAKIYHIESRSREDIDSLKPSSHDSQLFRQGLVSCLLLNIARFCTALPEGRWIQLPNGYRLNLNSIYPRTLAHSCVKSQEVMGHKMMSTLIVAKAPGIPFMNTILIF